MRLTQTLSYAVEKKYVGAVFFVLKMAFDSVWHKGLLAKIRFAGVTEAPTSGWQAVCLNDTK